MRKCFSFNGFGVNECGPAIPTQHKVKRSCCSQKLKLSGAVPDLFATVRNPFTIHAEPLGHSFQEVFKSFPGFFGPHSADSLFECRISPQLSSLLLSPYISRRFFSKSSSTCFSFICHSRSSRRLVIRNNTTKTINKKNSPPATIKSFIQILKIGEPPANTLKLKNRKAMVKHEGGPPKYFFCGEGTGRDPGHTSKSRVTFAFPHKVFYLSKPVRVQPVFQTRIWSRKPTRICDEASRRMFCPTCVFGQVRNRIFRISSVSRKFPK